MSSIFSPGKLMLTSEYVAIDGALVLAVPTKLGQDLHYSEIEDSQSLIFWSAYHQDRLWLHAVINYSNWEILETNVPNASEFIMKVLRNVKDLSETKFRNRITYRIKTNLQFPSDYGLGSSSTLMNNLAEWASIDPYKLNELSLGGSGYDVAVAREKSAILYKNTPRTVHKINYQPLFKDELIFIHLNQKQDSREGINAYKSKSKSPELIDFYTNLTKEIIATENIDDFSNLMEIHESKLANFLGIKKVKDLYFSDCPVFVKSLGAWGGDFVLSRKFDNYLTYFKSKDFNKIYDWSDLINC